MEIPLHGAFAAGRVALIDENDYAIVANYRWYLHPNPAAPDNPDKGYARASIWRSAERKVGHVFMHALIAGPRPDHANGNSLDNRRTNLRPATRSQNAANCPSVGGSSRYKGVSWHKRRKGHGGHRDAWVAYIKVNGRQRELGHFDDEVQAARVYDAAAREAWGEYARLNFPE
jgi:hypothetical protein